MMAIRRFGEASSGNKNWVGLSNMDFGASGGAEQRYVWGSDGKLRWSDDSEGAERRNRDRLQ